MFYAQDDAERLSAIFPECERLNIIAKNMCCASVALWIMGIEEKSHLDIIASELGKTLEKDCTVVWQPFFEEITGRKINVEFKNISTLKDIKNIKGRIAVRCDYNGHSHWVGVENGIIKYNSKRNSNCVEKGKPATARIITYV